jgi:hypothetical protein
MTLDDILLEWSYRLPKGYPTMKDGKFVDQKELRILNDILSENKLNAIYTDRSAEVVVEEDNNQSTASLTRDQLIKLLADPKVQISDKNLSKISLLLSRTADLEGSIEANVKKYLAGDAQYADAVLDILYSEGTNEAQLAAYLDNRTIELPSNQRIKITDAFKDTGLTADTLANLALYRWSATPQLGTVEVLLALLLRGGYRPEGAGDLSVEGKIVELGGFNKRLRSQKGLGSSEEVQRGIQEGYRSLAESRGLLISDFVSISGGAKAADDTFKLITGDANYGNSLTAGWLPTIENMNSQLIELTKDDEQPVTKAELVQAIAQGFRRGLLETTDASWTWMEQYLKADGTFNRKEFLKEYAVFYLDYYMQQEEAPAQSFIVTDATPAKNPPVPKTEFSLLMFPANGDGLRPHIYTNIGLTLPSYTKSAGIQGVAFALRLGKVATAFAGDSLDEDLDKIYFIK